MKKKTVIIVIVLCSVVLLNLTVSYAAGDIYFTAIDNTVEPLNDQTMPAMIGGILYVPYTYFSHEELGVYYTYGSDKIMLYGGTKRLYFDLIKDTVEDQDGFRYHITAVRTNGLTYVPVDEVCSFFELYYQLIKSDPAPVVRMSKGPFFYNENMFILFSKPIMQTYYDTYVGNTISPTAPTSPSPTYDDVTMYLSFSDLEPERFDALLDILKIYKYKCCIFVSADEIVSMAGLLRQAAGDGHIIGLWLKEGSLDEYHAASELLFKAAKLRTVLVSAGGDAAIAVEETASEKGLVFWKATNNYDGTKKPQDVINQLKKTSSSRISINVACTDQTTAVISSLLQYLTEKRYDVRRITETTSPTYTIG